MYIERSEYRRNPYGSPSSLATLGTLLYVYGSPPSLVTLGLKKPAEFQSAIGHRWLGESGPAKKCEIDKAYIGELRDGLDHRRYYMPAFEG